MSETPTKRRRVSRGPDFAPETVTPTKTCVKAAHSETNGPMNNADRSARRKSARRLFERNVEHVLETIDDDDELAGEDNLAHRILNDDEDDQSEEEQLSDDEQLQKDAATPSKRGRPRKKKQKQRTPSPPRDLPSHEQYFYDNRPGGGKTSNSTLASVALPNHELFFENIKSYQDPHQPELDFLHSLHERSFDQWIFELEQGFNLCFYGWGSKRTMLLDFAEHICLNDQEQKIVVVNGYNQSVTARDILTSIASAIDITANVPVKLGAQVPEVLQTVLSLLKRGDQKAPITLLIHSFDAVSLRRPVVQSTLARLASTQQIRLIATTDTRTFPIMWDTTLLNQFNWLFHDITTFQPFDVEVSGGTGAAGVVDEVNTLFGRTGRKMHGREGVMYVLRSLTENARSLYALLIAELLSVDEVEDESSAGYDNMDGEFQQSKGRTGGIAAMRQGIDFRTLYQKAASQFIATNEPTFRALLREFYDHEMLVSRKDALGGEIFGVPFRKEEMETILEELMV